MKGCMQRIATDVINIQEKFTLQGQLKAYSPNFTTVKETATTLGTALFLNIYGLVQMDTPSWKTFLPWFTLMTQKRNTGQWTFTFKVKTNHWFQVRWIVLTKLLTTMRNRNIWLVLTMFRSHKSSVAIQELRSLTTSFNWFLYIMPRLSLEGKHLKPWHY